MIRRARRSALALALIAAACAATRSDDDAQRELRAMLAAQQAAWNRGDLAAFMAEGYWNSEELVFYSGGSANRGYAATLARYRRHYESEGAERGRLEFGTPEIVLLADDVALVRGRWDLDFSAREDAGGLFSLVVRRLPEGWRIVHDHTSVDPAEFTGLGYAGSD